MVATKYNGWIRGSSGYRGFTIYYRLINPTLPSGFENDLKKPNIYNIVIFKLNNRYQITKILYKNWGSLVMNDGFEELGDYGKLDNAVRHAEEIIKKSITSETRTPRP